MNSFNYVTGVTVPYNACNGAYSVQKDNILKCVNKIKYLRLIWRQNHEIQHCIKTKDRLENMLIIIIASKATIRHLADSYFRTN